MRARTGALTLAVLALAVPALAKSPLRRPHHGGFQMKMDPFVVHPGQEREACEYRRLPNRRTFEATTFQLSMPAGAHHFVLWAYNGHVTDDSQFPKGMVDSPGCVGVGPGDSFVPVNVFGIQTPSGRVRFPPGIAVRLAPHQQ